MKTKIPDILLALLILAVLALISWPALMDALVSHLL